MSLWIILFSKTVHKIDFFNFLQSGNFWITIINWLLVHTKDYHWLKFKGTKSSFFRNNLDFPFPLPHFQITIISHKNITSTSSTFEYPRSQIVIRDREDPQSDWHWTRVGWDQRTWTRVLQLATGIDWQILWWTVLMTIDLGASQGITHDLSWVMRPQVPLQVQPSAQPRNGGRVP